MISFKAQQNKIEVAAAEYRNIFRYSQMLTLSVRVGGCLYSPNFDEMQIVLRSVGKMSKALMPRCKLCIVI